MARWFCAIAVFFLHIAGVAHAQAGRRVALVVTNSVYENAPRLANPANDGRLVSRSLQGVGFQSVDTVTNANKRQFEDALRAFRTKANGAELALIYYAGHGIEGRGENWLLPTDATLSSELDLSYEAIALDRALDSVSGARLRVVILDACRNNPFARGWRSGTRAVANGLAGIEADDVLVLYAAAPGQTASDGVGPNSPFASALAQQLPQPGVPIQMLGFVVRDEVIKATGGRQKPFVSASITSVPYYLVQPPAAGAEKARPADNRAAESAYWNSCCSSQSANRDDFEGYLNKVTSREFSGTYADIARRRISTLGNTAQKMPSAPPPVQSSTRLRECIRRMGQNIASAPCPQIDNDEQVRIELAYTNALASDAPVSMNWSGSFKLNFLVGIKRDYVLRVQRPQMTPGQPNCRNINATLDIDGQGPRTLPTETYCNNGGGWVPVA